MRRNNFFRVGIYIFATLLTLSCYFSEARPQPPVEPYVPPVTETSPTSTPLPSLPDFHKILSFGGGGGGGDTTCEYPGVVPAIQGVNWERYLQLCLWGVDVDEPVRIKLTSPDGRLFQSADITVRKTTNLLEPDSLEVSWKGYETGITISVGETLFFGNFFVEDNNVNKLVLYIKWPDVLLGGIWKVEGVGIDFRASTDMDVEMSLDEQIAVQDMNSENLLPFYENIDGFSPVSQKDNGKLDAVGRNFPTNELVYVLLYRSTCCGQMMLIQQQTVLADHTGTLTTEMSGPFEPNAIYVLMGISKSNLDRFLKVGDQRFAGEIFPHDFFTVTSLNIASDFQPSSFTCPGAPPQRMVVNQRGYVCTKNNPVFTSFYPPDPLVDYPNAFADSTPLMPGIQFMVTNGPWCAGDKSWWRIQTDDFETAWAPEGGDAVDPYFICPMP